MQATLSSLLDIQAHPIKRQLAEQGISAMAAAKYINRSYPYVLGMLNGRYRMNSVAEAKLRELIALVIQLRSESK